MTNEKRLIDANAFKGLICECCNILHSDDPCEPSECSVMELIDSQPKVDAVEVVHGKWVDDTSFENIVCTECGHMWNTIDNCTETFNYCPNCGAKMDGDGNE